MVSKLEDVAWQELRCMSLGLAFNNMAHLLQNSQAHLFQAAGEGFMLDEDLLRPSALSQGHR